MSERIEFLITLFSVKRTKACRQTGPARPTGCLESFRDLAKCFWGNFLGHLNPNRRITDPWLNSPAQVRAQARRDH